MRCLAWALGAFLFSVSPSLLPDVAQAQSQSLSMVFEGQIRDVPSLTLPQGRFVSAQGLVDFLRDNGGVTLQSRPEKGLIVLTLGEGKGGALSGFSSSDFVLMVGDQSFSTLGQVQGGVPYIPIGIYQTALTGAGFTVVANPEAGLMAISRPPAPEAPPSPMAPPGSPAAPGGAYPGAGMVGSINQGVAEAMNALQGGGTISGGQVAVVGASGGDVCAAMDDLRASWGATEPSAQEKRTFQELAQRFQNAKEDPSLVDKEDVTTMVGALNGYKAKVEERSAATQQWQAPSEAARVKSLGNAFLGHYLELMETMVDVTDKMEKGESMPREEIKALEDRIKGMEAIIHSEGRAFDAEVTRVRRAHGCGPATLGKPAS